MSEGSLAWDVVRALGEAVASAVIAGVLAVAGAAFGGFVGLGMLIMAAGFALGAVLRVVGVVLGLGIVAALLPFEPTLERIGKGRLVEIQHGIITTVVAVVVVAVGVVFDGILAWIAIVVGVVLGLGGLNLVLEGAIGDPVIRVLERVSGSAGDDAGEAGSDRSNAAADRSDAEGGEDDDRDVDYHDVAGVDLDGIAQDRTTTTGSREEG